MATFADLDQFYDPGLTLTINGRQYQVPLPSAELGLWCQRIITAGRQIDAASSEAEIEAAVAAVENLPQLPGDLSLPERVLGSCYQQLLDDQVEWPKIQFAGQTALVWIAAGEQAAERFWTAGGRPEAVGPANRAERRAQRIGGSRTGAVAATRKAASTSGTSTPKKSAKRAPGKASLGKRSSATGR